MVDASQTDAGAAPADAQLEAFLTEAIELLDAGDEEALEALLVAHPDLAERAAEPLVLLRGMGLAGEAPGQPPLGGRVGGHRLIRRLGQGAMGVVWLAVQESVGRPVALKLMRPELSASPSAVERFRREARAVARLSHPNIVALYDAGEDRGVLWSAMALVPGEGLDDRLADPARRPDVRRVLAWCADLARALHAAHEAGVVHRDVKPANVRVTPDDRAMLLDFGLARDADAATLTVSGSFQGSPAYAAPEQVQGLRERIGPWTDVYALGVLLYEGVTGRVPFGGGTTEHVFHRILAGEPEPIRRQVVGVPRDLELVIEQAMDRDPERRYPDAAALARDLDALLAYEPVAARPPGPVVRARRLLRRHRKAALGLGALALMLAAFAVARVAEDRRAEQARREQAAESLAEARRALAGLAGSRGDWARLSRAVAAAEDDLLRRWSPPEVWSAVDADAAERARLEEVRRSHAERAAAALDRVPSLDPGRVPEAHALRLELALEQWRGARGAEDASRAADLARVVSSLDEAGEHADELALLGTVSLGSAPAGAEVVLFRYVPRNAVVPGAGPRLVAVPHGGAPEGVEPGTWALRPVADHPVLRPDDRILAVAGHPVEGSVFVADGDIQVPRLSRLLTIAGEPVRELFDVDPAGGASGLGEDAEWVFVHGGQRLARTGSGPPSLGLGFTDARGAVAAGQVQVELVRDATRQTVTLDQGAATVPTASPLFVTEAAGVGVTPLELSLAEGGYLALLRRPGHQDVRVPFDLRANERTAAWADLSESAPGPPGFVLVAQRVEGVEVPFWIQEREVTSGEYLAFLNRQESADVINGSPVPVLYPRNSAASEAGVSYWPLDGTGWFYLAPPNRPANPVYGVSLSDAQHYAAWMEEQHPGWRFTVPTLEEVGAVRAVSAHRRFIHGDVFRPSWVNSYHARPVEWLADVYASPVDESPHGVFNLAGGVAEWSTTPGEHELVAYWGGAFSYFQPEQFDDRSAYPALPTHCQSIRGFRLVARRASAGR